MVFVWPAATAYAFYLGTLTWYNIFIAFNEEMSCCHKLLSPFVLLLYPLWIAPVTLLVGLAGAAASISWYWDSWTDAVTTCLDCGFFNWFCNLVGFGDASPYHVIVMRAEGFQKPPCAAAHEGAAGTDV